MWSGWNEHHPLYSKREGTAAVRLHQRRRRGHSGVFCSTGSDKNSAVLYAEQEVIPTEWTCLVRRWDMLIEEGTRGLLQMATTGISSSVQGALRCTDAFRFCSIDYHSPRNPAHAHLSHF